MNIENVVEKNVEIENRNKEILNNILSKSVNTALNFALKSILPDVIENQVIDIKDALLEKGLQSGINTAINSIMDIGKSAGGLVTGRFENLNQVKIAIGDGGIISILSSVIDKTVDKIYKEGIINANTRNVIIKSKEILLNNISETIDKEFRNQSNIIKNMEDYIDKWKCSYSNKDFLGMEKMYNKMLEQKEKIIPLENMINEYRRVENLHILISNNGHNFELSDLEKELIKK